MKLKYIKEIAFIMTILLLVNCNKIAFAQDIEPRYWLEYRRALEDTAIRYELIKPIVKLQEQHNKQLENENTALRNALKVRELQAAVLLQKYERELIATRRRERWIGRLEGGAFGLLLPFIF